MSDKLLDSFHLRRRLHNDIEALGDTSSEKALAEQVRAISREYEADLVLSALRRYLNTSSSQLRGGLGRLSALLPYDDATSMLRQEAANRNNPSQTRLTAALILERFLDAEIPSALMSDLNDPEVVVMQSLEDAVAEGRENPYVLLEYVRQMRQESSEVAFMVIDLIDNLSPPDRVELLRLIAFDQRESVAEAAAEKLASLRSESDVAAAAAESLHSLAQNLDPGSRESAERSLRKMRFGGVTYEPTSAEEWRGLVTPCGFDGLQDVWFLHASAFSSGLQRENTGQSGLLVGLRINLNQGLMDAFGSSDVDPLHMPPQRQLGELLSIAITDDAPTVFLEVPVSYARQQLVHALEAHWEQPNPGPLPDEYVLYSRQLFSFVSPDEDASIADLLDSGEEMWAAQRMNLVQTASELLRHPVMGSWYLQDPQMRQLLDDLPNSPSASQIAEIIERWLRQLPQNERFTDLSERLRTAMKAQAGWLALAGQEESARQAVYLTESLAHLPPTKHPLVALMAELGLMLLLNRRSSRRSNRRSNRSNRSK